ncbi:MAG TPA: polysaccharide deacetylase family protein [Gemmataceae bacterium]|nr:polysaccharide deacetylase family protein [Gemmataceae bacterium]
MLPASCLPMSRRGFLAACAAGGAGLACGAAPTWAADADGDKALIAVTLDLEMSRNFPTWDQTEWDYEKGNLNAQTKRYAVEAGRRVKKHGGVLHYFSVGRELEQPDVSWLKEIAREGHPVGNHTYDHVYIRATKPEEIQFRFRRCPWLIEGRTPREVIRDNIRLATAALKERVGITAAGFRAPGGFSDGLETRPDLRQMLRDLGFDWISSKYPAHPVGKPGEEPGRDVLEGIVKAQAAAQPFVYPDGLIEVPMSPISDIGAFRNGRWKLEWFLKAIRMGVEWAIENRAVFDYLSHPSCLYVMDPEFRAIELVCELANKAGDRAALVDLNTIARRAKARQAKPAK